MKLTTQLQALFSVIGALALPAYAADNMTKDAYKAEKERISVTYKSDRAACDAMAGNAKDVCVEEAKGKQEVAQAELEFKQSGKASDRNKIALAKADADYAVAKEKCDDKGGDEKALCVKEAKAAQTKARTDAKQAG